MNESASPPARSIAARRPRRCYLQGSSTSARVITSTLAVGAAVLLIACASTRTVGHGSPSSNASPPSPHSARALEMVARIDTTVDPDFVYRYEQSRFVPPEGKTLLIVGQDLGTIAAYRNLTRKNLQPA